MQPMLDRPPGLDDTPGRDDIIIEQPPASPWGSIIAFILIMAIVVVALALVASDTTSVSSTIPTLQS